MNELQVFNNPEFGEIRTVEISGKIYAVGADIARALGYDQPHKAIERHCRYGMKRTIPHPQSPSKSMEMNIIPEGDMYRLIANSKLPAAEKFEIWVFDEVLPTIRHTGGYIPTNDTDTEESILAKAVIIAQKTITRLQDTNNALQAENTKQQQLIGELKPKADYVDFILTSMGVMATTQVAADYGISANRLNKILHEERIQRKVGDQWVLYAEHMNMGYTKSETIPITRSDGRPDTKLFTKWTQKGRLMINEVLNRRGIYANMDLIQTA